MSATVDAALAASDAVVETTYHFGRHTGVCLEARAILADWNEGDQRMTVYHAHQAPHMMQDLFAKHLGLEEQQVRVITKDVGGSFGIKVHTYADEMAVGRASRNCSSARSSSSPTGSKVSSPTFTRAITACMRKSA